MSIMPSVCLRCDSCGKRYYSGAKCLPLGWVQANIVEQDEEEGDVSHLHVCPECAAKAVDEYLPSHTWWGCTDCWRVEQ